VAPDYQSNSNILNNFDHSDHLSKIGFVCSIPDVLSSSSRCRAGMFLGQSALVNNKNVTL
jgi:hypothetical protein